MAYGDSEAEQMDAYLAQQRAAKWAAKATEEAECNKPLRDKLAAAEADTKLVEYLSSLRSEVSFHYPNGNHRWTFIPDVMRCDEPDGIFEGETLRAAIAAAKTATP